MLELLIVLVDQGVLEPTHYRVRGIGLSGLRQNGLLGRLRALVDADLHLDGLVLLQLRLKVLQRLHRWLEQGFRPPLVLLSNDLFFDLIYWHNYLLFPDLFVRVQAF